MKTVPAVPRLVRFGSRPRTGLGLFRGSSPTIRDANGRVWPKYDVTKPHYDGSPCGDHCLPFLTPDGPMRWLNEPDPTRPPARPLAALRGYAPWSCPPYPGKPAVASPLYGTPCRPPSMGALQTWTCPNGDRVTISSIPSRRGVGGCAPCGGLSGGCGKCPCQPPSIPSPTTVVGPGTLTARGYAPSPRGVGYL